jgi:hypothetical protein
MIVKSITGDDDHASGVDNTLAREIVNLWCEYEGIPSMAVLASSSSGTSGAAAPVFAPGGKVYTAESSMAHQLDKLEMIIQADEYERAGCATNAELHPHHLQSFFNSTCFTDGAFDEQKGVFKHPEVCAWVKELVEQRQARLQMSASAVNKV